MCVCVCVYKYIYMYIHTYTYTYNGIPLSHEKNKILPFVATRIHLEGIILSEITQKKKILYEITYKWGIKKIQQSTEHKKEADSDREKNLVVTRVEEEQHKGWGVKGTNDLVCKIGSRIYCIKQGIYPTFCDKYKWKVNFITV